jgi:hypothetical protein
MHLHKPGSVLSMPHLAGTNQSWLCLSDREKTLDKVQALANVFRCRPVAVAERKLIVTSNSDCHVQVVGTVLTILTRRDSSCF